MSEASDGTSSLVQRLEERIRELERRVSALEVQFPTGSPQPKPRAGLAQTPHAEREPSTELPTRVVPVLGKAVLAIAGAYLLRAIAESAVVPKRPVLMVAIVYAAVWIVWAARIHVINRFASATFAVTSAIIMAPLLWESTVRFQILSPGFSAVVLTSFVLLGFALAWRDQLQTIPWIVAATTVIAAFALIIATHEVVPLVAAVLFVAFATEVSVSFGHRVSLRAVPALAADIAILILVDLLTSPGGVPEGYHPSSSLIIAGLCVSLLAIYAASIGIRVFWQRRRITLFEIGQAILAFVIATYGANRATHQSTAAASGMFFLVLSIVCYWGALARFREDTDKRNHWVFAIWAATFFVAGVAFLFPASLQAPCLCAAASTAAFAYRRSTTFSMGVQISLFLLAAALVSSLPAFVAGALTGGISHSPDWQVWIVTLSAALCYGIGGRVAPVERSRRMLWFVPALLTAVAAGSLTVTAVVSAASGRIELTASRLSVIRTLVNCALALVLGLLGSRWKRPELLWVAYTAVVFGSLKLLFEDLRFGSTASLVLSLLFYGLVLIILPRFTQRKRNQASAAAAH
ncbi:MAG TPA: hypothetical protein VKW78_10765 [Terriglobales bacterium]|nr:hypothetical protein [Terriglobales bacterium]